MAEYIEREKIREEYEKLTRSYVRNDPYIADWRFDEMIESLPAADVATVRHGRWICIRKGYGEYECSVCHGVDSDCSDYYGTHVVTEQDYCPNCGSRMDGDNDG